MKDAELRTPNGGRQSAERQSSVAERHVYRFMRQRLIDANLLDIADRLDAGARLTLEDGTRLFECPDLLALGWLANRERERRHGSRTFYNQAWGKLRERSHLRLTEVHVVNGLHPDLPFDPPRQQPDAKAAGAGRRSAPPDPRGRKGAGGARYAL